MCLIQNSAPPGTGRQHAVLQVQDRILIDSRSFTPVQYDNGMRLNMHHLGSCVTQNTTRPQPLNTINYQQTNDIMETQATLIYILKSRYKEIQHGAWK